MLAVFGLGNPGRRYRGTRHNVGFEVIDRLAERCGASVSRRRYQARVGEADTQAGRLLLVKPQTFMNDSGRAVAAAAGWHRLEPDELLVVCDDLDIEPGRIRVRRQGSSGGHKGLRSVGAALGTDAFPRLRVGIGRPPVEMDAVGFVLARFSAGERETIDQAVEEAADAVLCWAGEGIDACMNRFN
ncbi:MAG: aminoacyl-tRNA hydrolase [Planctomycetota bacterium]